MKRKIAIIILVIFALVLTFGSAFSQQRIWTGQNLMNPKGLVVDSFLTIPRNGLGSFMVNPGKDSLGGVLYNTTSNRFIGQYNGVKKAFATDDVIRTLSGKKALVIGDSFVELQLIQDTLSYYTGLTVVSDGISGTCITGGMGLAQGDNFMRKPIVDRIDAALAAYPDLDVVVIEGGSNDWAYQAPLGTLASSDTLTFYGSWKYIIQKCMAYSRPLQIMPVVLMQRGNAPFAGGPVGRFNYYNQAQYAEATKIVAKYYGLAVADVFNASGITYENIMKYTNDAIHPNTNAGKSKYGKFLAENALHPVVPSDNLNNITFAMQGVFGDTVRQLTNTAYKIQALGTNPTIAAQNANGTLTILQSQASYGNLSTSSLSPLVIGTNSNTKIFIDTGYTVGIGPTWGIAARPPSTLSVNGSFQTATRNATTSTSFTSTDYTIFMNNTAPVTVALPAASASIAGRVYEVIKTSNNGQSITITGAVASAVLTSYGSSYRFKTDGALWWAN